MRRRLLFCVAASLLLFAACSKMVDTLPETKGASDLVVIDSKEVLDYVKQSMLKSVSEEEVEDVIHYRFPKKEIVSITPFIEEDVILYYVVNFDKGFAIVSGDKRATPVLCFSNEEQFELGNNQPAGFRNWLALESDIIKRLIADNSQEENENTKFWSTFARKIAVFPYASVATKSSQVSDDNSVWVRLKIGSVPQSFDGVNVPHILQTRWGEGSPWNAYSPVNTSLDGNSVRCKSGSLAVAIGQFLYHRNVYEGGHTGYFDGSSYPYITTRTDVPPGLGYAGHVYEYNATLSTLRDIRNSIWTQMPTYNNPYLSFESVSKLLADIGARLNQKYYAEEYNTGLLTSLTSSYYTNIDKNSLNSIHQTFAAYGLEPLEFSLNSILALGEVAEGRPFIVTSERVDITGDWRYESETPLVDSWLIDGAKSGTESYLTEYMWLRVGDQDGTLLPSEGEIIDGDNTNPHDPSADAHYDGEIERVVEYQDYNYYLANWCDDGNMDSVYIAISSFRFTGQKNYYTSRTKMFFAVTPLIY